jgi:hypothetical protein
MLIIRKEQMEALELAMIMPRYETAMIEHLRERHPEKTQDKSDDELRAFVREGPRRARMYGATEPSAYGQFIELMVVFGAGFDEDPAHPWAAEILGERGPRDGNEKMEALVEAAARYLEQQDSEEKEP